MPYGTLLLVMLLAAALSCSVTAILIRLLRSYKILDVPNERSAHRIPTPRGGGIGLLLGAALGLEAGRILGLSGIPSVIVWSTAAVAAVGLLDDTLSGISALIRLAVQTGAAICVVLSLDGLPQFPLPAPLDFEVGILGTVLAVLWMVAVSNIYNFLDGMDGYAGTQGLIAAFGMVLLWTDRLGLVGAALAGGCMGFLIFNWHPARIFLGDVGSASLGFLFSAVPFALPSAERSDAVWMMAVLLWFFLSDGTFTLLRRLAQGERIWEAHRSHLYQRLLQSGKSPASIVLAMGAGTISLGTFCNWLVQTRNPVLVFIQLPLAVFGFILVYRWSRVRHRHQRMEELALHMDDQPRDVVVGRPGLGMPRKNGFGELGGR